MKKHKINYKNILLVIVFVVIVIIIAKDIIQTSKENKEEKDMKLMKEENTSYINKTIEQAKNIEKSTKYSSSNPYIPTGFKHTIGEINNRICYTR